MIVSKYPKNMVEQNAQQFKNSSVLNLGLVEFVWTLSIRHWKINDNENHVTENYLTLIIIDLEQHLIKQSQI